jgi:hypothetical protein
MNRTTALLISHLFICVALCQCSNGIWGTLSYQTRTENGFRITDIRSTGFEFSNLEYRRGITLGTRKTTLAQNYADPHGLGRTSKKFGHTPKFPGKIIHVSTVAQGIEFSADSTFAGVGIGINSRSATILPAKGDEAYHVKGSPEKPEQFSIHHYSP